MTAEAVHLPPASQLPERVAQVVHALMEAWEQEGACAPVTAEVCVYDSTALSVQSTAVALTQARRLGLVSSCPGPDGRRLWWTDQAWEMRRALEDRLLGAEDVGHG
jgi:hypothetical protein